MFTTIRRVVGVVLMATVLPCSAQSAPYDRPPVSTPADLAAIMQVTVDFRAALGRKDVAGLSELLLNQNILFAAPPSPSQVSARRERGDTAFTGGEPGGFPAFAAFVTQSPVELQEKFYNIKVLQDGHLAWVTFDFEFLAANKVENHGVESWQLLKTVGDRWKIMSVVWSSHGVPK